MSFLRYLNGRLNNIKFTIESEQDNEIPFLDMHPCKTLHQQNFCDIQWPEKDTQGRARTLYSGLLLMTESALTPTGFPWINKGVCLCL